MQRSSILVVEDDDAIRETLALALGMEGYAVTTAANGREGLEALRVHQRPCLILLDLMMPVMNGWEFAGALEADTVLAQIPIVVVTAYADEPATINARAIMKKPVDLDTLLETVKEYCD